MKHTKIYAENLDPAALKQFTDAMSLDCVVSGALMADAHLGYSLPIGAVVAVKDHISPAFVGYDIGCGMCAMKLDIEASSIDKKYVFDEIYKFDVMELQKDLVDVIDHIIPLVNIKG